MIGRGYRITIHYSHEDGGWIADIPDLVTCSAFGDTPVEALVAVEEACRAWLATAREMGHPIPEPEWE